METTDDTVAASETTPTTEGETGIQTTTTTTPLDETKPGDDAAPKPVRPRAKPLVRKTAPVETKLVEKMEKPKREPRQGGLADFVSKKKQEVAELGPVSAAPEEVDRAPGIPPFPVDDFTDMKEIGRGQFGVVKRAIHKPSNSKVAIKAIRNTGLSVVELVKREYEMLVESEHQSSTKAVGLYADDLELFLVMEFVGGGEMFEHVQKLFSETGKGFGEDDCARLFQGLISALNKMHKKSIVHWDLKPQNILCDTTIKPRVAKLTDFGLARRVPDPTVTRFRGTAQYCAPEMLEKQHFGVEADMWSMGCVLYLMLSGKIPFDENNFVVLCELVSRANPDLESAPWDSISTEAKDLIRKLLVVDHTKRLSAEEVLKHPWFDRVPNTTLSKEQIETAREVFHLHLESNDNHLAMSQLDSSLKCLGYDVAHQTLEVSLSEIRQQKQLQQRRVRIQSSNRSSNEVMHDLEQYSQRVELNALLLGITKALIHDKPENIARYTLEKLKVPSVSFDEFVELVQLIRQTHSASVRTKFGGLLLHLDSDHDSKLNSTQVATLLAVFSGTSLQKEQANDIVQQSQHQENDLWTTQDCIKVISDNAAPHQWVFSLSGVPTQTLEELVM